MKVWTRTMLGGGLALALASGSALAQTPGANGAPTPPTGGAQGVGGQGAGVGAAGNRAGGAMTGRPAGDLPGPMDSFQDMQDTGQILFKMADANNDHQISQKEATDAANLMVGGFFFRADANGDGALSQEEANQAREALYSQQPLLRYVIEKARFQAAQGGNNNNQAATNPAAAIGSILDTNNDKQLQATEVRQVIQTGVQGMFAVVDTNRDGQVDANEINAAILGAVRTAAQAGFQQADTDNNGQISRDEFNKSITEPANMVFGIFDANNDGQISQQEADGARRIIAGQLRYLMVPEPTISPRALMNAVTSPNQGGQGGAQGSAPAGQPGAPR